MKMIPCWLLGFLCVALLGCGRQESKSARPSTVGLAMEPPKEAAVQEKADAGPAAPGQAAGNAKPNLALAPSPRKIKFTADIRLIADDFAKAVSSLDDLVEKHKGYVAHSDINGSPGSRMGNWKLRIPVDHYRPFCAELLKIGDVEKNSSDSEDVTEEYHDLENELKNLQTEAESLRELMKKSANTMQTFLQIRDEMNKILNVISVKQGRLKLLTNLTDLTTVTLVIRERQKFIPEKTADIAPAPQDFSTRVDHTFSESFQQLTTFGQHVALIAVAAAPWLPVVAVVAIPAWLVVRRRRRLPKPSTNP